MIVPVLHHGEETILLRTVEAMDLVDEQQRLATAHATLAGGVEHLGSATPEKIAEICSKASPASPERSLATVVLPVPGGPQKIIEPSEPDAIMRDSTPSSPVRCSCPATSLATAGAAGRPRAACLPCLPVRTGQRDRSSEELHEDTLAVPLDLYPPYGGIVERPLQNLRRGDGGAVELDDDIARLQA